MSCVCVCMYIYVCIRACTTDSQEDAESSDASWYDSDSEMEQQAHARPIPRHEIFDRNNLQLAGVTCLWMASKLEEVCPPSAKDFSDCTATAYSGCQIVHMERQILQDLEWRLHAQTQYTWLNAFVVLSAKFVSHE